MVGLGIGTMQCSELRVCLDACHLRREKSLPYSVSAEENNQLKKLDIISLTAA